MYQKITLAGKTTIYNFELLTEREAWSGLELK